MRRSAFATLLAVAVGASVLTGCTGSTSDRRLAGPAAPTQAELAYGRAPQPGGGITYQPDVVLVGGGAGAVRSVSADGLTWTIDANARHASDLAVGKVMFLTNRGVGRIMHIGRDGSALAVTLGPVDLGDVIRDGTLHFNHAIDVSTISMHTYSGVGGLADVTETSGNSLGSGALATSTLRSPAKSGQRVSTAGFADEDPSPGSDAKAGTGTKVSVNGFSLEVASSGNLQKGKSELKIGYKVNGVVLGVSFGVEYTNPQVHGDINISGGKITNGSYAYVSGIDGTSMSLESGSAEGLSRNIKARVEVPVEENIPLPTEPIPFNVSLRFKFIAETAFSARNGTLTAEGETKIDGPVGFRYEDGYTLETPTVTVKKSPIETMFGPSVGLNAVVIAVQFKVLFGLGASFAEFGPFAALTVSYGLTNGSSVGIVHCMQTSLDVVLSGGIGLTVGAGVKDWLKTVLGPLSKFAPKTDSDLANASTSLKHYTDYAPKVAVCKGSE